MGQGTPECGRPSGAEQLDAYSISSLEISNILADLFDLPFLPALDVGQLKGLDSVADDLELTLFIELELGGHDKRSQAYALTVLVNLELEPAEGIIPGSSRHVQFKTRYGSGGHDDEALTFFGLVDPGHSNIRTDPTPGRDLAVLHLLHRSAQLVRPAFLQDVDQFQDLGIGCELLDPQCDVNRYSGGTLGRNSDHGKSFLTFFFLLTGGGQQRISDR